jgi:hypothetical protein
MSYSKKEVKLLNKGLAKAKGLNAAVVASTTQGNGHIRVVVKVKGYGDVEVIGAPSTPDDFNHVANHLRQSVKRAIAAGETRVAYS